MSSAVDRVTCSLVLSVSATLKMRDRSKQDRVSGTVLPATPTAVVSRWYPILILCRKINRYKDDDDDDISVADTT